MSETAQAQDPINITADSTIDAGSKKSFLGLLMWGLFISAGLYVGYYVWQKTEAQTEIKGAYENELSNMRQDILTLKADYQKVLERQTPPDTALQSKVEALEKQLVQFVNTPQGDTNSVYLYKIMTFIALKGIAHKIETGISFEAELDILKYTPLPLKLDMVMLTENAGRSFPSLDQLQNGLQVFEEYMREKDTSQSSLITQMGDFLKIKKTSFEAELQNTETLARADNALELDDINQAVQILHAAFPNTNEEIEAWFKDADLYLEGQNIRSKVESWTSKIFVANEAGETL